jgi:hypothetical protein
VPGLDFDNVLNKAIHKGEKQSQDALKEEAVAAAAVEAADAGTGAEKQQEARAPREVKLTGYAPHTKGGGTLLSDASLSQLVKAASEKYKVDPKLVSAVAEVESGGDQGAESPAGAIYLDGWKTLWNYCANGKFSADDTYKYGFDPLNNGDVAVSTFYSSSLYGKIDAAAESSDHPLLGALEPENWALVDIADGTYYIAEYLGILDRAGRTEEETEAVKAFAEWFGSAAVQAEWGEQFDSFPCNTVAAAELYPDGIPAIYQIPNFALNEVEGGMTYAEYVAAHNAEWTNILTNLGFYWKDASEAPAEPDWDNLDWATLTQKAE